MYELRNYLTRDGRDIFAVWQRRLRDSKARLAVERRINRLRDGNFGDHKACGEGVWEIRIDLGPGYRMYYALDGQQIVLLICGGDKSSQSSDIERAIACWQDWKGRADER